jgi:acyl-CoA synthetase (AMP-forming)/AMP-acid ligase II
MIYRSPAPDVPIPDVSLPAYVLERIAAWGDKPALIDAPSGRTLTYRALGKAIRACAAGLTREGFRPGDVLAIVSPNLPEYAVAFYGAALAGGTTTTANPVHTEEELARQLADAGARFLVTVGAVLDKARAAAERAGVERMFTFDGAADSEPFAALLAGGGAPPTVTIDPARDVVVLPYSSGTTGLPKGVMLTHRNLVANLCQIAGAADSSGYDETDTVAAVLPFFHIYGMVVLMSYAVVCGCTVVTLPHFELEPFLATIQAHRVTRAALVPPIVVALAKHPAVERYDLSSLRVLGCGAAPLGREVAEAATRRLGCPVLQGFGLTETSPATHVHPDRPGLARPGTVGRLVPNTEMRLVDPVTGQDAPPGGRGEVWIRGPQVMKGYHNQPEATAATLTPDGWLRTGDVGTIDADGYTSIVDRLKELIKYKGYQVAPAELEALLLAHPAVADAAVIPSPDEEAGEVPKAFVVLRADAGLAPEALLEWVAERVAPYKRVRRLAIVEQIPKSASGKILRRVLIEQERLANTTRQT